MAWIMAGTATPYPAEIRGGQNFGEGQPGVTVVAHVVLGVCRLSVVVHTQSCQTEMLSFVPSGAGFIAD
jgi:hypothetical protein